jgi:hypothetical protein
MRRRRRRALLAASTSLACYAGIALFANYPDWPGDPNRIRGGDLDQMAWYLAWTPHALLHWQNLFATTWLNYPGGVNLAQNTSVPLLGLLAAPLTLTAGPVASLNLLLWLAFPLSAFAMYLVVRRLTGWSLGAFVAGALYGFSPYVVTQGLSHLNLAFVPLPPLILLCAYEMIRPEVERPLRWGIALGGLILAQFFISPEIAATTLLVLVCAGTVLGLANRRIVLPTIRRSTRGFAMAGAIVVAGCAYPTWIMVAGPYRYRGPAYAHGFSADLLSAIAPTPLQKLTPVHLAKMDAHLLFGNLSENGGYLGIPLILLLVVLLVWCRRNRWMRFAAGMACVMTILSFGPHLVVHNRYTTIPLPWGALRHLPLANNVIVARFSLYTDLFAALMVGIGMNELRVRWRESGLGRIAPDQRWTIAMQARAASVTLLGALAVITALSLVPAWPLKTTNASVPPFFTSAAVSRVRYGSVVLISPYPSEIDVQSQLWQAVAGMRFRIIGGYALVSNPFGASTVNPAVLRPEAVQRFLWAEATGGPPYPAGGIPVEGEELACQLRSLLLRYRVDAVVSTRDGVRPRRIVALYTRAMGPPSYVGGGAVVWFRVPDLVAARISACTT